MRLNPIAELSFTANDVYILENIAHQFFINENEQRILILNENLDVLHSIDLPQPIGIYSTLSKNDGKEAILYSPDDNLLIYCDILNNKGISIDISQIQYEVISPLYHWDNHIVLLTTYDKHCYKLDLLTKQLDKITFEFISLNYPDFYAFWMAAENFDLKYQINSSHQSFIYVNKTSNEVVYFDFKHNKKTIVKDPESAYHDIVYCNGYFIFVSEKKLTIIHDNNNFEHPTQDPLYIFLRVRFIKENDKLSIVTLISNKSDNKINKIIKYELLA